MSASHQTSYLNTMHGTSTKLGPYSNANQEGTSENTVGSTTAAGHGDHPRDRADDADQELPSRKYGLPQEDLDGEKMAAPAEGRVMDAQLKKKHAGWGEQDSLTMSLERKKAEQARRREVIEEARRSGYDVDGGASWRTVDEDSSAV